MAKFFQFEWLVVPRKFYDLCANTLFIFGFFIYGTKFEPRNQTSLPGAFKRIPT